LEQEILLIDEQMAVEDFYRNTPKEDVRALQQEREAIQDSIDEKLAEWENLN
jgi:hypothetical protein